MTLHVQYVLGRQPLSLVHTLQLCLQVQRRHVRLQLFGRPKYRHAPANTSRCSGVIQIQQALPVEM